jgi:hypothetical protein
MMNSEKGIADPQRDSSEVKTPPKKNAGEAGEPLTPEEVLKKGIDKIIEKREKKSGVKAT